MKSNNINKINQHLVEKYLFNLERYISIKKENPKIAFTSGFKNLDSLIKFNPGELVIVGGRCGTGKTTFSLNLINNLSLNNRKPNVLYFSAEMRQLRMFDTLISINLAGNISLSDVVDYVDDKLLREYVGLFDFSSFYIDDTENVTLEYIKTVLKLFEEAEIQLNFVVIDHLGLIKPDSSKSILPRHLELEGTIQGLKTIARERDLNMIILSQLLRSQGNCPSLESLKGSSSIEEHADCILALHPDSAYDEIVGESKVELFILKNRNGNKGILRYKFRTKYGIFEEIN